MVLSVTSSLSLGQSANIIHYQGRVTVSGIPFNGAGSFKFALLNESGTATLWSNDGTSVDGSEPENALQLNVSKGLFRVGLGKASIENMASISDELMAKNAKLRVWFNSGSNGWQRLQPDQEYSPSSFAMRATKADTAGLEAAAEARIRSMEDTFVINELDDHAYRGLSKPLISPNLVWESFPIPNGTNGRVFSSSEGSYYDQQFYAMSFGVQDLAQVGGSGATGLRLFKTLVINGKVHRVEAEFNNAYSYQAVRFTFRYTDSTSIDVNFTYSGPYSGESFTAINPQPTKLVSNVDIYFNWLGQQALVKNAKVAIISPASVTISLSPQSANWSSFRAYTHGAREVGDDVKFSITDGSTTLSNLSLNTVYSWSGISPPTSLILTLTPKADGTIKGSSVTTMGVFYNQ